MTHIPDDKFRVFISHKHEDHDFATTVAKSLRSVSTASNVSSRGRTSARAPTGIMRSARR